MTFLTFEKHTYVSNDEYVRERCLHVFFFFLKLKIGIYNLLPSNTPEMSAIYIIHYLVCTIHINKKENGCVCVCVREREKHQHNTSLDRLLRM